MFSSSLAHPPFHQRVFRAQRGTSDYSTLRFHLCITDNIMSGTSCEGLICAADSWGFRGVKLRYAMDDRMWLCIDGHLIIDPHGYQMARA